MVIVSVLVAVYAAAGWLMLRAPSYEARASLLVTPVSGITTAQLPLIQNLGDPTRTIQTAAALIENRAVATAAAVAIGGDWTERDVSLAVDVLPRGQTNMVDIRARAANPEQAATVANAFAAAAVEVRDAEVRAAIDDALVQARELLAERRAGADPDPDTAFLVQRINELELLAVTGDTSLRPAEAATIPRSETQASPVEVMGVALAAGLVIGVVGALILDTFGTGRLVDPAQLEATFAAPVLARIPRHRWWQRTDPNAARQTMRTLAAQLGVSGQQPRRVLVTSPSRLDERAGVTAHVAIELANAGWKVIVADLDGSAGLIAALGATEEDLGDARTAGDSSYVEVRLVPTHAHPGILCIDGRQLRVAGYEPRRLGELLDVAAGSADVVLVDAPPVNDGGEIMVAISDVDVMLLVLGTGQISRHAAEESFAFLNRTGHAPDGLVVIG
jgi:capsular polysaccharide biosynthesis protein